MAGSRRSLPTRRTGIRKKNSAATMRRHALLMAIRVPIRRFMRLLSRTPKDTKSCQGPAFSQCLKGGSVTLVAGGRPRYLAGMSVTLEIPDGVSAALRLPPAELKRRVSLELAVSFYAQGLLSLGKAAELAGLTRWELNDLLAQRGVTMHYADLELREDVTHARGGE